MDGRLRKQVRGLKERVPGNAAGVKKTDWKVQKKGVHGWEITETGSGVK